MAHMEDRLSSKHETMSSNPSTGTKTKDMVKKSEDGSCEVQQIC
jgi:hypothetical protein